MDLQFTIFTLQSRLSGAGERRMTGVNGAVLGFHEVADLHKGLFMLDII
jgi:hypothetical protein